MSVQANFNAGSIKDLPVISCSYGFSQNINRFSGGRPESRVISNNIFLQVAGGKETDLLEWMADPHGYKDGSVKFISIDSDATLKELKFTRGTIVSYQEGHTDDGTSGHHNIMIEITAETISIGEVQHLNDWDI